MSGPGVVRKVLGRVEKGGGEKSNYIGRYEKYVEFIILIRGEYFRMRVDNKYYKTKK